MSASAEPIVQADIDAARGFLELRYGDLEAGWFHLFVEDKAKTTRLVLWYDVAAPDAFERAARDAVKYTSGRKRWNVWASVNLSDKNYGERSRGGDNAAGVSAVLAFGADIDVGKPNTPGSVDEALAFVRTLPLRPSLLTCSGGGVQAYWTLKEPETIATEDERLELRSSSMAWGRAVGIWAREYGWTFDSVFDLPRILRLPGTLNHKGAEPRLAYTLHEGDERYTLEDMLERIPDAAWKRLEDIPAPEEGERVLTEDELETLAALFVPSWRDGKRHDMAVHVSGYLANKGLAEASVLELVRLCSTRAGDEHTDRKLQDVRSTYRQLRDGKRPMGARALRELMDARGFRGLDEFFPFRPAGERAGTPRNEPFPEPVEGFNLTDLGNAERMIAHHGADLRYLNAWKTWLVWNGTHWEADERGLAIRYAGDTVRAMYAAASRLEGEDEDQRRKALVRHALQSERDARLRAMVFLAQSRPGVSITQDELDADPWALNVLNGTLDLRTGELRPHDRRDLITRIVRVNYRPGAESPTWRAFLREVFAGDAELVGYIQRLMGYAITGSTEEHAVPIFHGAGSNGKSTLLETVRDMLGPYGGAMSPELVLASKHDQRKREHEILELRGVRLATAIETSEGRALDEAILKWISGGDKLRGRGLYRAAEGFTPTHTLILSTNHKPRVKGEDHSIWRRLHLVPFTERFWREDEPDRPAYVPPEREVDTKLRGKLEAEAEGILAWLVEGALMWQESGLQAPERVRMATAEYRTAEDATGRFLEERCVLAHTASVKSAVLYAAYKTWCEAVHERPVAQHVFGERLATRGLEARKYGKNGDRYWFGIGLRDLTDEAGGHGGHANGHFAKLPHEDENIRDFSKSASSAPASPAKRLELADGERFE